LKKIVKKGGGAKKPNSRKKPPLDWDPHSGKKRPRGPKRGNSASLGAKRNQKGEFPGKKGGYRYLSVKENMDCPVPKEGKIEGLRRKGGRFNCGREGGGGSLFHEGLWRKMRSLKKNPPEGPQWRKGDLLHCLLRKSSPGETQRVSKKFRES